MACRRWGVGRCGGEGRTASFGRQFSASGTNQGSFVLRTARDLVDTFDRGKKPPTSACEAPCPIAPVQHTHNTHLHPRWLEAAPRLPDSPQPRTQQHRQSPTLPPPPRRQAAPWRAPRMSSTPSARERELQLQLRQKEGELRAAQVRTVADRVAPHRSCVAAAAAAEAEAAAPAWMERLSAHRHIALAVCIHREIPCRRLVSVGSGGR